MLVERLDFPAVLFFPPRFGLYTLACGRAVGD
jgi:hypothetical protein